MNNSTPHPRPDQSKIGQGNVKAYIVVVIIYAILGVLALCGMVYMGLNQ